MASFRAATTLGVLALLWAAAVGMPAAHAVEAINVPTKGQPSELTVDLTGAIEYQHSDSDRVRVSTAPGPDGIVRRVEVRAREADTNWAVFALANNGDQQIDRLIVAPHYRMVGSGLLWPDLGQSRIVYITPSSGDPPELQRNASADVYRVTLDPGTVITFVAELRTPRLPQLYLWEPDAYKDKVNSLTLYQGIVIGIAGLLGAVPDHSVCGQGQHHVPGRSGAELGGAGLYRDRFRLLGQGVRHVVGRRAGMAGIGRSDPGGDTPCVFVRLPQPQSLARSLCPHYRGLARVSRRADRGGLVLA